jgi:glycosyltransferase involved in cell wall biosynthesis
LVNVLADTASTGRICRDLYLAYTQAGHQCCIAYGRKGCSPDLTSYKIGNVVDMYAHGAETILFDNHGMASRSVTRRFLEFVRAYDPDVIHLHNIHGYYLNFPMLFDYLKTEFRGRVIWTLHDMWTITGHSAHLPVEERYVDRNPRAWQHRADYPFTMANSYSRNVRAKKEKFSGVRDMTLIAPSDWLAGVIRQSYLGQYSVVTVHNGIDTAEFHRYETPPQDMKTVLAVASIWARGKGLPDVVKLADRLPPGYRVRVVGKLMPGRRLPANIDYVPRTESVAKLAQEYSSAWCLVNPTRHETLSTVNIEAQACGTPVITYDTDGAPETIVDGVTGRVVTSNTVDEMAEDVMTMVKDESVIQECVKRGAYFSRARMGHEYLSVLEDRH